MGKLLEESAQDVLTRIAALAGVKPENNKDAMPLGELELSFQHSIFCQMRLPYRNPKNLISWTRRQGDRMLKIDAGRIANPAGGEDILAQIPWGTKARLILAHLNAEALRHDSPEIDVGESLYAFARRITRCHANGREMRAFNDQVSNLGAATVHFRFSQDTKSEYRLRDCRCLIIDGVEVRAKKDGSIYAWNSHLHLSDKYFESLKDHAVPLNEAALAALSQNAMALDVYAWLAERLHRINPAKPAFIPWTELQGQFGDGYQRFDNFKSRFSDVLKRVQKQYDKARIELNGRGMLAYHSAPPVSKRLFALSTPR
jgi:Plasmid encoded RepA protein